MTWKKGADERFLQFIADNLEEASMVESFVLVATAMKGDGDITVLVNCAPDQRSLTTIGLLRGAIKIEEAAFLDSWISAEDDDDT